MRAECSACGTELATREPELVCPACGARVPAARESVPPASVRVRAGGGARADYRTAQPVSGVELELRAFSWSYAPLVAFALLWDALSVFLCVAWLPLGQVAGAVLLLPVEALLLAAVLSYVSLVALCEKTELTLNPTELSVRRRPLPWLRAVELPLERVRDVRAESDGARWLERWSLSAIQSDGHAVRLLHDASEREARYAARALRAALRSLRSPPS